MRDHRGCKRGFIHMSAAWWGASQGRYQREKDKVRIGFYRPDGSTTGEFYIGWELLCGSLIPRLYVFDDAWSALFNFGDMLKSMADADDQNVSPEEFCKMLVALGIEDLTPREQPKGHHA